VFIILFMFDCYGHIVSHSLCGCEFWQYTDRFVGDRTQKSKAIEEMDCL